MKKKFLSIIFAAVMATCGVFAAGCGKGKDDVQEKKKDTVVSGNVIVSEEENQSMSLLTKRIPRDEYEKYGVTQLTETAYTLTATVSPAGASDQTVDWTIAWVNSTSTWASGKNVTDYITITPSSDGALTATLACVSAFGEQVKVTVTSRSNASAKASCTVDYAKKIQSVSMQLYAYKSDTWTKIDKVTIPGSGSSGNLCCVPTVTFSVGTISDNYTFTMKYRVYDWVYEHLRSLGSNGTIDSETTSYIRDTPYGAQTREGTSDFVGDMKNVIYPSNPGDMIIQFPSLYSGTGGLLFSATKIFGNLDYRINKDDVNAAYLSCVSRDSALAYYEFTMVGTYSSYTVQFPVQFNNESIYTETASLSLNKTGVVF